MRIWKNDNFFDGIGHFRDGRGHQQDSSFTSLLNLSWKLIDLKQQKKGGEREGGVKSRSGIPRPFRREEGF